MKNLLKPLGLALALTVGVGAVVTVMAPVAMADVASSKAKVDAAKAQGIVGEKVDGYLGFVVASQDAGLKAAVAEINAGRRDLYQQAATKNSVSIEAAGASAFSNIILPKMPAGQYYQDSTGNWQRK